MLLDLLSAGPAFQHLTDLAERSGLSLPTVHRLLRSLMAAGLVCQDPRSSRYGLGPELVRLSEHYLERLPVVAIARPHLAHLRDRLASTAALGILVGTDVVYVDRASGPLDGGPSGRRCRALDTAAGRVLLAAAPPTVWERATAPSAEGHRIPDHTRTAWLRTSYLTHAAAPDAATEVAAPIVDVDGTAVAALALLAAAGTTHSLEDLGAAVAQSARSVAQRLHDG